MIYHPSRRTTYSGSIEQTVDAAIDDIDTVNEECGGKIEEYCSLDIFDRFRCVPVYDGQG